MSKNGIVSHIRSLNTDSLKSEAQNPLVIFVQNIFCARRNNFVAVTVYQSAVSGVDCVLCMMCVCGSEN